jgi:hypothetical protein
MKRRGAMDEKGVARAHAQPAPEPSEASQLKLDGNYNARTGTGGLSIAGAALPVCLLAATLMLGTVAIAAVLAPGGCTPPRREHDTDPPSERDSIRRQQEQRPREEHRPLRSPGRDAEQAGPVEHVVLVHVRHRIGEAGRTPATLAGEFDYPALDVP